MASTRAATTAGEVTKDNEDADDDSEEENPPADFDPYLKPQFWYINASLFPKRTKDAHSGEYAMTFYPNGGSFLYARCRFQSLPSSCKGRSHLSFDLLV